MNCYYYAKFKNKTISNVYLIGLSGNAKQRRKMLRAFKRSNTHTCFDVTLFKARKTLFRFLVNNA
jgi:hypothetical protein